MESHATVLNRRRFRGCLLQLKFQDRQSAAEITDAKGSPQQTMRYVHARTITRTPENGRPGQEPFNPPNLHLS